MWIKVVTAISIIFLLLIAYCLISFIIFLKIFKRQIKNNDISRKIEQVVGSDFNELRHNNLKEYEKQPKQQFYLETKYGKVFCEILFADEPTKNTIVCCHGYQSNHRNFISGYFGCYKDVKLKFNLCLFDFIGCGQSEGKYISLFKISNDTLSNVIAQAHKVLGNDINIFLHGVSLGAYNALNFALTNNERIKGVIFDSGFYNPYHLLKNLIKNKFFRLFLPLIPLWSTIVYGESYFNTNLLPKTMKTSIPILFFHGESDNIVPLKYVTELIIHYSGPKKSILKYSCGHGLLCLCQPEIYKASFYRFIDNEHLNRIALIGFMGAGKTTLGRMLYAKYHCTVIDTDEEIVKDTGKSLEVLFNESESKFRQLELAKLQSFSNYDNCVLSCGGGTPQISGSYDYLKKWTIIYLKLSPVTAYKRSHEKKPYAQPWSGFKKLCNSRDPIYSNISDFCLNVEADLETCFVSLCSLIEENNLMNLR